MSSLNPIGLPFIELATVDSTNNYAMGLAHAGMAQHGTAVFAHEQVKGKGQRNKTWVSGKGQNISLSIILNPELLSISPLFLLSMATAIAVKHLLDHFTNDEMRIKWPNDLYWRDRKAAGILIENLWQGGRWKNAIVGIGININQDDFGELQSRAVSLKQITGKDHDPLSLAKLLCTDLIQIAAYTLEGEIQAREGKYQQAIENFRKAIAIEDALNYNEPPDWFFSVRLTLGHWLVKAGQFEEAEAVYRQDLTTFPENGWALKGLFNSLSAQGKKAEAQSVNIRFELSWKHADMKIESSRGE